MTGVFLQPPLIKLWTHPEGTKARVQKTHKEGLVNSTSLRQWPLGWAELSARKISYSVAFISWLSGLAFQMTLLDDGSSSCITWNVLVLEHLCGSYCFVKPHGSKRSHGQRSWLEPIWSSGWAEEISRASISELLCCGLFKVWSVLGVSLKIWG